MTWSPSFRRTRSTHFSDPIPSLHKDWKQIHPGFAADLVDVMSALKRYRKEVDGVVYFLGGGDKVKIGKSMQMSERLRTIQAMSPVPLELLGSVRGYSATEQMLHQRWGKKRAHGEWFYLDAEIRGWIESNNGRPVVSVQDFMCENSRDAHGRVAAVLGVLDSVYGPDRQSEQGET